MEIIDLVDSSVQRIMKGQGASLERLAESEVNIMLLIQLVKTNKEMLEKLKQIKIELGVC